MRAFVFHEWAMKAQIAELPVNVYDERSTAHHTRPYAEDVRCKTFIGAETTHTNTRRRWRQILRRQTKTNVPTLFGQKRSKIQMLFRSNGMAKR